MAPIQREERGPIPKYDEGTDFFTVEFIHGGFFVGTGCNRAYLDGNKVCYDYCEAGITCMEMMADLVEHLGYEMEGRINIYLLLPGMQMNEDGLKLISRNIDTNCIRKLVKEGFRYLMFYLDHEDSNSGDRWDDVVANPSAHLPPVISPMKSKKEESNEEHSMVVVDDSSVELMYAYESNVEGPSRRGRTRAKKEDDQEFCSESDSDDSDYAPEIVDSDYDLEDGDEDLIVDDANVDDEKKGKRTGKQVAEDANSEDGDLELPDSDDEDMKFNFKFFTEEDLNEPKFHVGQVFSSIALVRKAIREYSCKKRLAITLPKNDKTRVGAKCADGCPWYLYASYDNRTNGIMVKTFKDEHTCTRKWQVRAFTARSIAEKYVDKIRANEKMTIKGLGGMVQQDWNMKINRQKLWRARKIALEIIYGDDIAQYKKLWDYAAELRRSNPGSTFFVQVADDGQFQKCYFSFDACKRGFLSACRPVIFLDGCHLKTQFGGILLTAIGMDPNDCIYPVAFAVVQIENTESWRWFLAALKEDLGIVNTCTWTVMSDKQKGLIKAVRELFIDSEHRYCVRHIWQNFSKTFKGDILKNQLWRCARSTTHGQWRENMDRMLVLNKDAHDWLEELDPKTWVRAFQSDFPKCDVLLNNNCEVFNKYILDAREFPIMSMIQRIKGQVMGRICSKLQEAQKCPGTICPKIRKRLMRNVEAANTCHVDPAGHGIFEVQDRGVQFHVDIKLKKCSCRRWDLTGIPCCHGVAALRYEMIAPESMVHQCYSIETYCKAYENIIMPCKDVSEWQCMYGTEITPPKIKTKKGRKKKNRRQQPEEKEGRTGRKVGRGGAVMHCSYCGGTGHNIGGCRDFKLGLKPKKKGQRKKVRAEPEVSSDEEAPAMTQEENLHTMGLVGQQPNNYEAEVINSFLEEQIDSQNMEPPEPGPLPGSFFIECNVQSQPPMQPTITKEGNVHRKREVLALAKLRETAEKREVADQAKFHAAMAKLKEEEQKILQASQKRKEEAAAKKLEKEEKKKAHLLEKQLAGEEKRKAAEERKKKAQQEKQALAHAKRQALEARKKDAEEAKQKRVAERKSKAEEKRKQAADKHSREQMEFMIFQQEEQERLDGLREFLDREEKSRQQAWEGQVQMQSTARIKEWEEKNKMAEELNRIQAEEARQQKPPANEQQKESTVQQQKQSKRSYFSQPMSGFKKPRKTSMFDYLRRN